MGRKATVKRSCLNAREFHILTARVERIELIHPRLPLTQFSLPPENPVELLTSSPAVGYHLRQAPSTLPLASMDAGLGKLEVVAVHDARQWYARRSVAMALYLSGRREAEGAERRGVLTGTDGEIVSG
jgi:hypothetical protein